MSQENPQASVKISDADLETAKQLVEKSDILKNDKLVQHVLTSGIMPLTPTGEPVKDIGNWIADRESAIDDAARIAAQLKGTDTSLPKSSGTWPEGEGTQ